MPRKGENIYKRKDGRWEGRYILTRKDTKKTKYGYVYAKSYSKCKEKLIIAKAEAASTSYIEDSIQKDDTIQKVIEKWLVHKKPQIKESSFSKYCFVANSYIIPTLGLTTIKGLTKKELQDYVDQLMECGGANQKGLSTKTVADILTLLKSVFRYAVDVGYQVSPNICDIKIHQSQKQLRVFSVDEQRKLVSYLVTQVPDCRAVGILLCLFTGIRIGELCALRWEDISIPQRTIHIHKTLQRLQKSDMRNQEEVSCKTYISISTPKSSCSIRTIPIPENFMSFLEHIPEKNGYLLTSSEEQFIEPRTLQYYYKKQLELCGIEKTHFHTLRHTFATRCIELGFDVKTLSELLGHSNVSITMNRYVHPSFELKRESMEKLSGFLAVE